MSPVASEYQYHTLGFDFLFFFFFKEKASVKFDCYRWLMPNPLFELPAEFALNNFTTAEVRSMHNWERQSAEWIEILGTHMFLIVYLFFLNEILKRIRS